MKTRTHTMTADYPHAIELSGQTRYCYTNRTEQMQIVRMANLPENFFERTVLPGAQISFAATADAELEIHTYDVATAILAERITCDRLVVHEPHYAAIEMNIDSSSR